MNKNFLLVIGALSCGLTSGAVGQSARQIDRHVAEMRRYLHLSGQQAGSIRADLFAASDEKKAISQNPMIRPYDRKARIHEVSRSTNHQIEAILSPAQISMWRDRFAARSW